MPKPQFEPAIIDSAPLDDNATLPPQADYVDQLENLLFTLQAELDESQAENERLTASQTVEQVRARMMEPFARRVFVFVMCYCIAVGIMIVSGGNKEYTHFVLSDMVLTVIAGSTAVSVIGLIGIVLAGLFASPKS